MCSAVSPERAQHLSLHGAGHSDILDAPEARIVDDQGKPRLTYTRFRAIGDSLKPTDMRAGTTVHAPCQEVVLAWQLTHSRRSRACMEIEIDEDIVDRQCCRYGRRGLINAVIRRPPAEYAEPETPIRHEDRHGPLAGNEASAFVPLADVFYECKRKARAGA